MLVGIKVEFNTKGVKDGPTQAMVNCSPSASWQGVTLIFTSTRHSDKFFKNHYPEMIIKLSVL